MMRLSQHYAMIEIIGGVLFVIDLCLKQQDVYSLKYIYVTLLAGELIICFLQRNIQTRNHFIYEQ